MNIDGLTNKQLLTAALRAMLDEALRGSMTDSGICSCYHPLATLDAARAALLEVDRPKADKSRQRATNPDRSLP